MSRHIRLPEAVQVEKTLGQTFGGCHVGAVASVGEGVAAAQTQPVTEVLVQLRVGRQTGLVPAGRGGGEVGQRLINQWVIKNQTHTQVTRAERKEQMGNEENQEGKMEIAEVGK